MKTTAFLFSLFALLLCRQTSSASSFADNGVAVRFTSPASSIHLELPHTSRDFIADTDSEDQAACSQLLSDDWEEEDEDITVFAKKFRLVIGYVAAVAVQYSVALPPSNISFTVLSQRSQTPLFLSLRVIRI